jgi:peptidyl-prolyl cis-trans isomerase C
MKKSCFIAAALMAATVINAADQAPATNADAQAKAAVTMPKAIAKPAQPAPIDWSFLPENVAEINGKKISKKEFVAFFEEQMKMMPFPMSISTEQVKKFAPQLVDQLVSQELLAGLAEKAGFQPSAKMVADSLKERLSKLPPEHRNAFMQQLASRKMTMDQFIQKQADNKTIQIQYAVGEWVKSKIGKTEVTDKEIDEFYAKNKDDKRMNYTFNFKTPGDAPDSVRASHILIKPADDREKADKEAKAKAEAILERLKKGESFEEIAKKESACGSSQNGGSLGSFTKGQMVKEFEDAAYGLKVGETSGLVKTKFGYHIIRRDAAQVEKVTPFEEVKPKIAEFLKSEKERTAFTDFIKAELQKEKEKQKVQILVK